MRINYDIIYKHIYHIFCGKDHTMMFVKRAGCQNCWFYVTISLHTHFSV